MEDFVILNTGYQKAINDSLNELKDLNEFDLIKSRLDRISEKFRMCHDETKYKGILTKYYDKKNNLGYVILNDINHIEGILLLLSEQKYEILPEKELIFIENTMKGFKREFDNEKEIKKEYNKILNKFKKQ